MDEKKKIVLATEDIKAKSLEDIYINVNLQQKFNVLKKEKFDNNFDLAEQFRKERNASRDFRIYGIIDSKIIDSDNVTIKVYSSQGDFGALGGLIKTVTSQPIGFGDKNVFGKMRGKYLIELNNYKLSDTIYLEILGDGVTYARTVIERPLVYRGADGEFVEYGTETVDIGLNGEFVTINNDFPFFYNKHWIKTNFQVEEVKVRNVKFGKSSYSIDEGNDGVVTVELSEPSVFGTESVVVTLTSTSVPDYNTAIIDVDFDINNFPFGFPMNLSWNVGQKTMDIDVSALTDYVIEKGKENFSLALTNPSNVTTNNGVVNISATTVSIVDKTPKKYVNYIFQKIIRNITPISSLSYPVDLSIHPNYLMNTYGADSNVVGPPDEHNNNYKFFPNDKFELKITNEGIETSLPIIPGFTTSEQYFGVGQSISIDVVNKYVNHDSLPLEIATLNFKEKDVPFFGGNYYDGLFFINGIQFPYGPLVADEFVEKVNQKYSNLNLELPFEMTQVGSTVTLTAKHPADNINVLIPKKNGVGFGLDEYALQGNRETPVYPSNQRVDSITEQIPFELKLYANSSNATSSKYKFEIIKPGYKTVEIPSVNITATSSGNDVYLVTPIRNVKGPTLFGGVAGQCSSYVLDSTGYYINGVTMIAGPLFGVDVTATNTHASGYLPSFRPSPLVTSLNTCNNNVGVSKVLS